MQLEDNSKAIHNATEREKWESPTAALSLEEINVLYKNLLSVQEKLYENFLSYKAKCTKSHAILQNNLLRQPSQTPSRPAE